MYNLRGSISVLSALAWVLFLALATARAGDDWRPVSAAELAQKAPVVEKDADAEAIFWEVRVDDSKIQELALKNYVRVKIFTDRGREQFSKIDITAELFSTIKDVTARVINPDGSIIEIKKEDVFERTIVKAGDLKLKAKSFAVPGIRPGVIVEYRYREVYPWARANLDLSFQHEVPIETISFYVRAASEAGLLRYHRFNLPPDVNFVNDENDYHRITMTNVPAFREEPRMPPLNEVRPWVMIYYSNDDSSKVTDYWKQINSNINENLKEAIEPNDAVKHLAEELGQGAAGPEEKLRRYYDYCETKIRNLSYDTSLTDDDRAKFKLSLSPGQTLKRQMGWDPDIDLLFAALARSAGLEAEPVFAGDRGTIFFAADTADSRFIDFNGIAVKLADGWHYFDPGARFVPFGMLIWTADGQDAMVVNPHKLDWEKIPYSAPERSREKRTGKFHLTADGTLEGQVRIEYTGQLAYTRKRNNYDDSVNAQEESLKKEVMARLSTAELTDIKLENVSEAAEPFAYTFNIKVPGYAQRTGKRLFVQPSFFEHGSGATFTSSDRKFDIYFHYPWSEEDDVTIELPPGYVVDGAETPAPITPEMTLGVCGQTIRMGMSQDQKTLRFQRSFFFGGAGSVLFPKANYGALKSLFDQIHLANENAVALHQP